MPFPLNPLMQSLLGAMPNGPDALAPYGVMPNGPDAFARRRPADRSALLAAMSDLSQGPVNPPFVDYGVYPDGDGPTSGRGRGAVSPAVKGPTPPDAAGFEGPATPGLLGPPGTPAPPADMPGRASLLAGRPAPEVPPRLESPLPMRPTLQGDLAPTLDLPDRTPAEQAGWQRWWDHKDDDAYSAPGGYHPRRDIFELRGDVPSLTSAYGVQVPSNAALGRKYAAREQVGFQKQEADAKTSLAATEAAKAKALEDDLVWKRSPEGQAFGYRNVGIQAGNAPLSDQAAKAAAGPDPLDSLATYGMVPGALPRDYGTFARQYKAGGGPPIDRAGPVGRAVLARYGEAAGASARNDPLSFSERMFGRDPQVFGVAGPEAATPEVGPPAPPSVESLPPAPRPVSYRLKVPRAASWLQMPKVGLRLKPGSASPTTQAYWNDLLGKLGMR